MDKGSLSCIVCMRTAPMKGPNPVAVPPQHQTWNASANRDRRHCRGQPGHLPRQARKQYFRISSQLSRSTRSFISIRRTATASQHQRRQPHRPLLPRRDIFRHHENCARCPENERRPNRSWVGENDANRNSVTVSHPKVKTIFSFLSATRFQDPFL